MTSDERLSVMRQRIEEMRREIVDFWEHRYKHRSVSALWVVESLDSILQGDAKNADVPIERQVMPGQGEEGDNG